MLGEMIKSGFDAVNVNKEKNSYTYVPLHNDSHLYPNKKPEYNYNPYFILKVLEVKDNVGLLHVVNGGYHVHHLKIFGTYIFSGVDNHALLPLSIIDDFFQSSTDIDTFLRTNKEYMVNINNPFYSEEEMECVMVGRVSDFQHGNDTISMISGNIEYGIECLEFLKQHNIGIGVSNE